MKKKQPKAKKKETTVRTPRRHKPGLDDVDAWIQDLRAAGLDAWDDIENPDEFIREMREE